MTVALLRAAVRGARMWLVVRLTMRRMRHWGLASLTLALGLTLGYATAEWNVSRQCRANLDVARPWGVLLEVLREDPYNGAASERMSQLQAAFAANLDNCLNAFWFR
jgi:hypothetical protein